VAEFAARHDLIVVSDEIHSDLIYPGAKHVPMMLAAPEHADRIITINAASKTFGIPGLRTGYAIIPDPDLRAAYQRRMRMTEYSPGTPGITATKAAYSPEGAAWVKDLVTYLDGNRKVFDEGINAIPGRPVHAAAIHLPRLGRFLGHRHDPGGGHAPRPRRGEDRRQPGAGLRPGGRDVQPFQLRHAARLIEEAVARMQAAFSDLQ
jgi:cystathionine beta-lyase